MEIFTIDAHDQEVLVADSKTKIGNIDIKWIEQKVLVSFSYDGDFPKHLAKIIQLFGIYNTDSDKPLLSPQSAVWLTETSFNFLYVDYKFAKDLYEHNIDKTITEFMPLFDEYKSLVKKHIEGLIHKIEALFSIKRRETIDYVICSGNIFPLIVEEKLHEKHVLLHNVALFENKRLVKICQKKMFYEHYTGNGVVIGKVFSSYPLFKGDDCKFGIFKIREKGVFLLKKSRHDIDTRGGMDIVSIYQPPRPYPQEMNDTILRVYKTRTKLHLLLKNPSVANHVKSQSIIDDTDYLSIRKMLLDSGQSVPHVSLVVGEQLLLSGKETEDYKERIYELSRSLLADYEKLIDFDSSREKNRMNSMHMSIAKKKDSDEVPEKVVKTTQIGPFLPSKEMLVYCFDSILELLGHPQKMPYVPIEWAQWTTNVFVSWYVAGELRGCIGSIFGRNNLADNLKTYAIQAAFHDGRFAPISEKDIPHLKCEINYILNVEKNSEWEIGKHGIVLGTKTNHVTFLPEVMKREGWTKEQTMDHLVAKSGSSVPRNSPIYRYETIVVTMSYEEFLTHLS